MSDARGRSEPIGHHLVLRLSDNRVIAPSEAERRLVARCVIGQARGERVLTFGLVDTHLHTLAAASWTRCGRLAQRIGTALKQTLRLPVGFAPVHREPVATQSHLCRAFAYDLRQQDHHGVVTDPYHDGSNLPDLLGLRVLGTSLNRHVRDLLPRVTRAQLLALFGVSELSERSHPNCDRLAEAAAAAAGLPDLRGRRPEVVQARAAAVEAAHRAGIRSTMIGELLHLTSRGVRAARVRSAPAPLVRAVCLQLAVRQHETPPRPARRETRPEPT